jgi:hypothetical protein
VKREEGSGFVLHKSILEVQVEREMSQQQAELVEKRLTSRHLPSEKRQLWERNTERRGCDKQVRPSVAAKLSAEEEKERKGVKSVSLHCRRIACLCVCVIRQRWRVRGRHAQTHATAGKNGGVVIESSRPAHHLLVGVA